MGQANQVRLTLPEEKEVQIRQQYAQLAGMYTQTSTAALVLPIVFLNQILGLGQGEGSVATVNGWFIASWVILAASIGTGLLFQWSQVGWIEVAVKGVTEQQLRRGDLADRLKWFFMDHMAWLFASAMMGLFLGVIAFAVGAGIAYQERVNGARHVPPSHAAADANSPAMSGGVA